MSSPLLTIIMPCFNCEATLEEAVRSIFRQNLSVPFEVVMVDDASSDGTPGLIKKLSQEFSAIRSFVHEKNKGGGAARNTAVENAAGSLIFCLDGDDILPDDTLPKMLARFEEKKGDGVLFEETRFFSSQSPKRESVKNRRIHEAVRLSDMFEKGQGFYARVNFLYTKEAWKIAGCYPTHHGFDTQTFGFRFLSKGLKTYVAPGTHYLHRRNEGASYFDREYRSGKLSFNTYLMHEDIFFLFSEKVKNTIINFDIFRHNLLGRENLEMRIAALYEEDPHGFFIEGYQHYLSASGESEYIRTIQPQKSEELFAKGVHLYRNKQYTEARVQFESLALHYPQSKILTMNIERCRLSEAGLSIKEAASDVYNRHSKRGLFQKIKHAFR